MDGESSNGSEEVAEDVAEDSPPTSHGSEESDTHPSPVHASPDNNNSAKVHNHFGFIDPDNNTCISCGDTDPSKTQLTCAFCCNNFHGVCRNANGDKSGSEVICTNSFYKTFYPVYKKEGINATRAGNFLFVCNVCKTTREQVEAAKTVDKVDLIDKRVTNLTESMEEMKSILKNIAATTNDKIINKHISDEHKRSYSSVTTNEPDKRSFLVMNANPANVDLLSGNNEKDLDQLITSNAIHVENTRIKADGSAIFTCPTEKDRAKLNQTLAEKYPAAEITQPPDLLPTISVSNLLTEYSKSDLEELILQQHKEIKDLVDQGEVLKVLGVRKQKNNARYQATIRVGNKIRKFIHNQGNRLFIVKSSCSVYDHFHVKRCNKCQRFGHYEGNDSSDTPRCKATHHTCGHCSGHHDSKICPNMPQLQNMSQRPCCNNCQNNRFSREKSSHNAFSINCPSYKAEQDKMRKNIFYFNSKNSK
jgi:hypothetical protein